jgi:hypothetical protein
MLQYSLKGEIKAIITDVKVATGDVTVRPALFDKLNILTSVNSLRVNVLCYSFCCSTWYSYCYHSAYCVIQATHYEADAITVAPLCN